MPHLWIINHYAEEPGGAGGTRHYSIARQLQNHGWSTTIIAASTEHLTGRQRLRDNEHHRLTNYSGISYLWVNSPRYSGNGLARVLNMLMFSVRVVSPRTTLGLQKPDVIIGSSVHPFAALSAKILAKRMKKPFIFEVRDLWPQALIDAGKIAENGIFAKMLRTLERHLCATASRVITVWPYASHYIENLGIVKGKTIYAPNGVNLDTWCDPGVYYGQEDGLTIMYFGAHGRFNDLSNAVKAMEFVQKQRPELKVKLRLIGDGPEKEKLIRLARTKKLTNVFFEPAIPKEDLPRIARGADVFLFNLLDAPMFRYGISPRKLFEYMAAARPVIFCCGTSFNPIKACGGGVSAAPGNPTDLARAIIHIATLPVEVRAEMGRHARQYVISRFSYDVIAEMLADELNSIAGEA